jgi:ABC-2 type transport system permease protein
MSVRALLIAAGTGARQTIAAPGALLVAGGFYVVVYGAVTALWRNAAADHGGALVGYSAAALVWYLMATESVAIALPVRLIETIADDVAGGTVAVEMLRPASVLGIRLATEVGRCLPRLAVCAGIGSALAVWLFEAPIDPRALGLAAPALVLAALTSLASQHLVGACAFWLRDARSLFFLHHKLFFVLGGMLMPLEVLPPALASIARWLPFAAMAWVPGRLASGHLELELLARQGSWLLVLIAGAVVLFRAGERRLQAVGG